MTVRWSGCVTPFKIVSKTKKQKKKKALLTRRTGAKNQKETE